MVLSGIWRGIIGFITTSVLAGVCIMIGIDPGQVVADFFSSPWISHPLVRLAALVLGGVMGFFAWKSAGPVLANILYRRRQLTKGASQDPVPPKQGDGDDLIPLPEAAIRLYDASQGTLDATIIERNSRDNDDPKSYIVNKYANRFAADDAMLLYGRRPPSSQVREITAWERKQGDVMRGGTVFQFLGDKVPVYVDLQIRQADVDAAVIEAKETR